MKALLIDVFKVEDMHPMLVVFIETDTTVTILGGILDFLKQGDEISKKECSNINDVNKLEDEYIS